MTLALVMGGGGIAGIAWHTGIRLVRSAWGPARCGAAVMTATAPGSTVAAQLGGGHPLQELFARQVDPATLTLERVPPVSIAELIDRMMPIYSSAADAAERRKLLGAMALDTDTVDEQVRRDVVASRLFGDDWPTRPLLVPVVEATTGSRRVLDRSSGVDLVDAVAASSAVPGVWPPVTLGDSRYIDGGVWSLTNTDLASGHDRVLVLAPIVDGSIAAELAGLGSTVRAEVVSPDAASQEAFGSDVLDPAVREPSARAGLAQGRAEADRIRSLLTD